jgi:phosphatidylglycerophosphatase A
MKRIALLWATFFGMGRIAIAPGTWASLVTAAIAYLLFPHLSTPYTLPLAGLIVYLTGIPAARQAELHYKKKDPRFCVIDEVAGQLVALFMVPGTILFYLASFLLFRFFDILKPFPVKQSEQLPHGIGIMSDDILAGAYACLLLHFFRVVVLKQPLGF